MVLVRWRHIRAWRQRLTIEVVDSPELERSFTGLFDSVRLVLAAYARHQHHALREKMEGNIRVPEL